MTAEMRPEQNLYIIGPHTRLYLSWSDDHRFWVVLMYKGNACVLFKRFKPEAYASALALFNKEKAGVVS